MHDQQRPHNNPATEQHGADAVAILSGLREDERIPDLRRGRNP
jgi:hypothetical protein